MIHNQPKSRLHILLLICFFFLLPGVHAVAGNAPLPGKVRELMSKGNIPGLSLITIKNNETVIENYGFADLEKKTPVTCSTLFEIGSCSKAFTALAVLKLRHQGLLNLNDPVSKYLPWFYMQYDHKKQEITLNQLLHHTSGIPFKTISSIPQDSSLQALEHTVKQLTGTALGHMPGTAYEYATINYDVLGLIIQQVSDMPFEEYMAANVFLPLGLKNTTVGKPHTSANLATGYKPGFFAARKYSAPVFRGNYPAGYVISNAEDMARWLKIQTGSVHTDLDSLVVESHLADLSVTPFGNLSYAGGWMINPYGKTKIAHEGNNPGFTANIEFYPGDHTGAMVLTNSNNAYAPVISEYALNALSGANKMPNATNDKIDAMCSIICIILAVYVLLVLFFMGYKLSNIRASNIHAEKLTVQKIKKMALVILLGVPYLYGIYIIPEALIGFTWHAVLVWTPLSFKFLIYFVLAAIGITYLFYFFSLIFAGNNKYKSAIPFILFLSVLSGLANTTVLFIITTSFYSAVPLFYLLYYFALAYGLYVIAIKFAQTRLIKLTNGITFNIRTFLINKISATRFGNFEKISDGRILTTLNNDTSVLANSANVLINFITNFITIFSAFLYMTTISPLSTLVVLAVVLLLVWYYYSISKKARVFMEDSRSIVTQYMSLLNNLVNGFRELSLHYIKKLHFKNDFISVNKNFSENNIKASVKFLNSSIIGNSFIMIVLGVLSIIMPRVSSQINTITLISFVMVLLYIIGPINAVLGTIQEITMIRVCWHRISGFIHELDPGQNKAAGFWDIVNSVATATDNEQSEPAALKTVSVESIDIKGLLFEYKNEKNKADKGGDEIFKLGPLDLSIRAGEIVFIVGGNGSGKSTFLHLLTGLYMADSGSIKVNGMEISSEQLGEYFSVIFSGGHLFQKIYGLNLHEKDEEIKNLLAKLKLEEKVHVKDNAFSTIDLSSGQKKRLALLKCFLEDRQVYMFDEFAADQDPEFRRFFYRELIPELQKTGKIIIAITHDDHYFDVADKVIKLDYGVLDFITANPQTVNSVS